jgi:hypothetical protein
MCCRAVGGVYFAVVVGGGVALRLGISKLVVFWNVDYW